MGSVLVGRYGAGRRPLWIDFSIEPASVPTISYKDVLSGDPGVLARLRDKKVLIGGTALELGDRIQHSEWPHCIGRAGAGPRR